MLKNSNCRGQDQYLEAFDNISLFTDKYMESPAIYLESIRKKIAAKKAGIDLKKLKDEGYRVE
jgi:hypothetical protein